VQAGRPARVPGAPMNRALTMSSTYVHDATLEYGRDGNTGWGALEDALGALDGGRAVTFASGLATATAIADLLPAGGTVVLSSMTYYGVRTIFERLQTRGRLQLRLVPADDTAALIGASDGADMVWVESIANPLMVVADVPAIAAAAHERGAITVVDSTFATPLRQRPLDLGADIVLHSATKFIGGHGTSIGGVVVDSGQFNWSNGRYPVVADPSPAYHGLEFHETFGTYGYLMKLRAETLRDLGACMSPFNAFLFLQGLETLSLRMARHVENASAVAGFLQSHELVSNVTYPGLSSSRYRPSVEKYLPKGAGAVFSFDCRGGRSAGQDFIRAVSLWSHLANVGDSKSLIIHPASTTHRQLDEEELRAAGVGPGTIRLSVGIEAIDDLIWDLEQGFARVAATATAEAASR